MQTLSSSLSTKGTLPSLVLLGLCLTSQTLAVPLPAVPAQTPFSSVISASSLHRLPPESQTCLYWSVDEQFATFAALDVDPSSGGPDLSASSSGSGSNGSPNISEASTASPSTVQISWAKGANPPPKQTGDTELYNPLLDMNTATNASLEYSVYFPDTCDFVQGGKLPGLYGGQKGCSAESDGADCFSTRIMWRQGGKGELYLYAPEHHQTSALCNTPPLSVCPSNEYGLSIGRGAFHFQKGAWTTIRQDVWVNSPGQPDGGFNIWMDGRLVLHSSDVYYRQALPTCQLPAAPPVPPKIQTQIKVVTATATAIQTQIRTATETQIQTQTQVQTAIQTQILTATVTAVQTEVETELATATITAVETQTQTVSVTTTLDAVPTEDAPPDGTPPDDDDSDEAIKKRWSWPRPDTTIHPHRQQHKGKRMLQEPVAASRRSLEAMATTVDVEVGVIRPPGPVFTPVISLRPAPTPHSPWTPTAIGVKLGGSPPEPTKFPRPMINQDEPLHPPLPSSSPGPLTGSSPEPEQKDKRYVSMTYDNGQWRGPNGYPGDPGYNGVPQIHGPLATPGATVTYQFSEVVTFPVPLQTVKPATVTVTVTKAPPKPPAKTPPAKKPPAKPAAKAH